MRKILGFATVGNERCRFASTQSRIESFLHINDNRPVAHGSLEHHFKDGFLTAALKFREDWFSALSEFSGSPINDKRVMISLILHGRCDRTVELVTAFLPYSQICSTVPFFSSMRYITARLYFPLHSPAAEKRGRHHCQTL